MCESRSTTMKEPTDIQSRGQVCIAAANSEKYMPQQETTVSQCWVFGYSHAPYCSYPFGDKGYRLTLFYL